jgi:diguanylate cyclase (GGDEF)-like protein
VLVAVFVVVVAVVGFGVTERNQASARRRIEERFQTRGSLAARFMANYVRQITKQEQDQAAKYWSGRVPTDGEFQQFVDAFGFQAAVLLDGQGRLLRVAPASPALLGQPIAQNYTHLQAAVTGRNAVSDVVPSAARNEPVIAFAVPLPQGQDARVFSGAFQVQSTPLAAFLNDASPIRGAANYLVDGKGILAATNDRSAPAGTALETGVPGLARATGAEGRYQADGESIYFVAEAVEGTTWRVLLTAPVAALYEPVSDTRWGSLALAAALTIAAAAAGILFLRNTAAREALERVTRTDALTGLPNRRHIEEFLDMALAAAARHGQQIGVLMADIDHFKAVNDTHGHRCGDEVLADIGARLAKAVRRDELVGRWGGEEFIVILPLTDADATYRAAERLRVVVGAADAATSDKAPVRVTMSIGGAVGDSDADALVDAADAALYAAKKAGRDRVAMASEGAAAI